MRTVHIIGSKGSGGAELFYVRLVQAIQARGMATLAINPPESAVAGQLGDQVSQYHLPMRGIWDLGSAWQIRRKAKSFDADIVQTYMGRATRLTRLSRRHRPVHVARLGNYYKLDGYRHAHAWVALTRGIRDYLIQGGLPRDRVFFIGNFVDLPAPLDPQTVSAVRTRLAIPDEAKVIVSVGRLHPVKGFPELLDAFARLPAVIDHRPLYLVIVGDGPLAAPLQQRARDHAVEARVRWAGWQTELDPYYALAEIAVCPSRHEAHGNVILEAWAHGRPLVSTRTLGGEELISDGSNGLLTPCEDSKALAEALLKLLQDPELQQRLAEAGLKTVHSRFSQAAITEAYLELYQRLGH